ncbi:MAG: M23 family metallopeptidase [Rhodospirillales bacterium]|nr:M23 family metallopeptidase [Alphaproteobacteria bacterium]MCB9986851.1 M23 family metallopeptidase [Rhodospirillales bacterium]USO08387.1 MAG: M23 family metallopeptidase [Rhodospirillales bacterium]
MVKEILLRLAVEGRHALSCAPATVFHALRSGSLPVKDRHVFTRAGRLRLRYVALIAAAFLGLASTNLSWTGHQGLSIPQAQASMGDIAMGIDAGIARQADVTDPVTKVPASAVSITPIAKPAMALPAVYTRVVKVKSGDTLSDLMQNAALDTEAASEAIDALRDHLDPRTLKTGQAVTLHYKREGGANAHLTSMEFAPTPLTRIILRQGAGGAFKVEKAELPLSHEIRAARTTIHTSLYGDLHRAGVPDSIIADLIKTYSYNVDFGRDIWAGDRVELLYDVNRTEDGGFVRGQNLIYAALYLRGKANIIYRFDHDGTAEYFDAKGNPIKKALMRTPIDGARVTSGFGVRHHPILGYTRMHKGVDFGAPTGTPIFAAGDGVIERAGWVNGFGKFVLIRHNGTYETGYGHMSAINVKAGQRVKQGQVIGRVGMTGYATGPHLHFEVRVNGTQVNPIKVANLSIGNKLGGKQLARFQAVAASARDSFTKLLANARPQLASAQR